MTIGEYVERRGLMLRYVAIGSVAVGIAALFMFPQYLDRYQRGAVKCLALPVLLLYGYVAKTSKCPRCQASLGESVHAAATPFSSDTPNACPHCGASFNEPMIDTRA